MTRMPTRLPSARRAGLAALLGGSVLALPDAVSAHVVVSALFGTTDTATNLAPTFVWVAFWVAVPLASVVLGDFYTALDPWRTIARVAGFGSRAVRAYPDRLRRWP